MRTFLAIELPDAVRAELAALQRTLSATGADVKWVAEAHLHLTLRFLGEIAPDLVPPIESLLNRLAGRRPAIQIELSRLGAFPTASSPRVIWVGIEKGSEELTRLAADLEEGLSELKLPQEEGRGFVAHVTLGRVRSPRHLAQLVGRLKEFAWNPPAPCRVTHVTFFQSTLTRSGPVYTALARAPFNRNFASRNF